MRGAPHISQDISEGWLEKVHRGHGNEADVFGSLGVSSKLDVGS